ncbi:hypothetical protein L1987_41301 [Smallanthus sonchifolius]|uniref:Uncharacterized protein n=1 Tax=Smallanthus sonchifolius TaxID=185202 RepID=A0ACB9GUC0_9ASTR|nr:hypothetical protein L1987_41301 [Smallanthus sonchifolius]
MGPGEESSTHEPKYTGVRKRKWGKWVSEIRLPNSRERIWLGSYDSPEKAARAFDAAAFCLRGSSARFNFPDQPPDIPGGRSLSPSGIQAAAARFANSVPDAATPRETHTFATTSSSSIVSHDNNYNEMGYDIFLGFDDYFMSPPPILSPRFPDYDEENMSSEGDFSQGPSFLWNF